MTAVGHFARFATSPKPPADLAGVIAPAVADYVGCILAGAVGEAAMFGVCVLFRHCAPVKVPCDFALREMFAQFAIVALRVFYPWK